MIQKVAVLDMDLQKYKDKLLHFSKRANKLYIYGAGNYGKGYFDVLQHNKCNVDGFIVTKKYSKEYLGRPVYSIEEISEKISSEDGIIPAFTNSNVEEIAGMFLCSSPQILDFDHRLMLCLENEIHFFPLMDKLDEGFPVVEQKVDTSQWNDILIVRLDVIGDIVFTTPFIRELRRNFPEGHVSVVIRKQNQKMLEDCPYIDELFLYDGELSDGELAEQSQNYYRLSGKIRKFADERFQSRNFDVVFFPRELLCGRNTIDELLIAYYSGARYRIGRMWVDEVDRRLVCERLNKSFTMICNPSSPMHEAAYALEMLRQCGCMVEDERMELWTGSQSEMRISRLLQEHSVEERHILIALGIVASVDTRTWRTENYNSIIRHYGGQYGAHIRFIIMGGEDAVDAAEQVDDSFSNVVNLAGKTALDETIACMKRCHLYVGSNTGLLHFASAWGVPSVTIYSELSDGEPTDGDSPFRMGAWKVPHIDLVPPAGLDGCHGVCRMRFSHCINQITPTQVIHAIDEMLNLKCAEERETIHG
ncbi:MAG TPA: hypothetical protein DDY31_10115 [Lachnospiraceae bacterium]|nr:hypothetical protein [Lachnospiraceae bacterium]